MLGDGIFLNMTESKKHVTVTCSAVFKVNPYLKNGFSNCYHLVESTFIFRAVRSDFKIIFNFSMKIL